MAPEFYTDTGYNTSVDFWAIGCILYEMVFGKTPFGHKLSGG